MKKIINKIIGFRKKYQTNIYLVLIVIIAFYFRTFNLNWDNNFYFHPDERAIVMFASPLKFPSGISEFFSVTSPLNPHFFAYGNFPLYLLKILGFLSSSINPTFNEYGGMHIVGRVVSATADTLTVFIVFLIGSLVFNKKIGLLSSLIYSLSVFPIQASHFYAVDSLLTFFTSATIYLSLVISKKPSIKLSILLGIFFGLALATKVSALIFGITILIIFLGKIYNDKNRRFEIILKIIITIVITGFTFIAVQPYVLIDFQSFITQVKLQSQMSKDAFIFPYTLQYVGKVPYIYELKNIIWGQGPIIFGLSVCGLVLLILNFVKKQKVYRFTTFALLFISIVYFLIFGKFAVGWMRYMLPLYPLFSLFAGYMVIEFLYKLPKNFLTNIFLRKSILIVFILSILIYPVSFLSIYLKPNTRLQATTWINRNIEPGKKLAIEHWDDALPVTGGDKYMQLTLPLYDPDTDGKWPGIENTLKNTDYILIASNRLYAPLQRLTDCKQLPKDRCYKKTAKYYKKLFSEELGFRKVAEFTSYPTIPFLNIELNDDNADESFTVYDHPKIMIFKKD